MDEIEITGLLRRRLSNVKFVRGKLFQQEAIAFFPEHVQLIIEHWKYE